MPLDRVRTALFAGIALLLILVLSFEGHARAAEPVLRPPAHMWGLVRTLADQFGPCPPDLQRPLGSRYHADLGGGGLLILLEIPDYLCEGSNTTEPLMLRGDGTWRIGPSMDGAPVLFGRGADGAWWLVTQWQIEATFPALYRSEDGSDWQVIPMPDRADGWSPFVFLDRLCFSDGRVRIRLLEETGEESPKAHDFSLPLDRLHERHPGWEEISSPPNADRTCLPPGPSPGGWTREEIKELPEVLFRRGGTVVAIPKALPAAAP